MQGKRIGSSSWSLWNHWDPFWWHRLTSVYSCHPNFSSLKPACSNKHVPTSPVFFLLEHLQHLSPGLTWQRNSLSTTASSVSQPYPGSISKFSSHGFHEGWCYGLNCIHSSTPPSSPSHPSPTPSPFSPPSPIPHLSLILLSLPHLPPKYFEVLTPPAVTLFGNRAFSEVTKLKRCHSSGL